VVNLTPRPLYSQGKSPSYPLNRSRRGEGAESVCMIWRCTTRFNVRNSQFSQQRVFVRALRIISATGSKLSPLYNINNLVFVMGCKVFCELATDVLNKVEPDCNDIGLCETLSIPSGILRHQLIPRCLTTTLYCSVRTTLVNSNTKPFS